MRSKFINLYYLNFLLTNGEHYNRETEAEGISEANTYIYPNPARKQAVIRYEINKAEDIEIKIYDVRGRKIWAKERKGEEVRIGVNYEKWGLEDEGGREVSNGVYIVKVKGGDKEITKKIAVVR